MPLVAFDMLIVDCHDDFISCVSVDPNPVDFQMIGMGIQAASR